MSDEEEVKWYKRLLCGYNPLGAFAEWAVGSAKSCWCCSFWRGLMIGAAAMLIFSWGFLWWSN